MAREIRQARGAIDQPGFVSGLRQDHRTGQTAGLTAAHRFAVVLVLPATQRSANVPSGSVYPTTASRSRGGRHTVAKAERQETMAQKMRRIIVAVLTFGFIVSPFEALLYRDAGAKPSDEMPRLHAIAFRSASMRAGRPSDNYLFHSDAASCQAWGPPDNANMTLLGETGSVRCRRSNRPGNSQAKGPQGVDCTLERGPFPKRTKPKG